MLYSLQSLLLQGLSKIPHRMAFSGISYLLKRSSHIAFYCKVYPGLTSSHAVGLWHSSTLAFSTLTFKRIDKSAVVLP